MIISKFSEILGKRKLKISDVYVETKISRPTLTALYYGTSKGINFDTLNKLCTYFKIQPNELLSFHDIDINKIVLKFDDNPIFCSIKDMEIIKGQPKLKICDACFFSGTVYLNKSSKSFNLKFSGHSSFDRYKKSHTKTGIYTTSLQWNIKRNDYLSLFNDDVESVLLDKLEEKINEDFPICGFDYIENHIDFLFFADEHCEFNNTWDKNSPANKNQQK